MKYSIYFHIFMIILNGCALSDVMKVDPTGEDKLDIYVNSLLQSQNLVVCEKIVDVENHLNHMICNETETDRQYNIPIPEWEQQYLDDYFSRVSKKDLKNKLSLFKNFKTHICGLKKEITCVDNVHYEPMEQLIPYLEANDKN